MMPRPWRERQGAWRKAGLDLPGQARPGRAGPGRAGPAGHSRGLWQNVARRSICVHLHVYQYPRVSGNNVLGAAILDGAGMFDIGPNEKVFPIVKISKIVDALKHEGVSLQAALAGTSICEDDLISPLTKISANQIVQSYRNALKCSKNPSFALDVGLQFSRFDLRDLCLAFAQRHQLSTDRRLRRQYHQLTAPLVAVAFEEQPPVAAGS